MASDQHQNIVKGMIDWYGNQGMTVLCAAYTGYDECSKHGRHEPDVVARDSSGMLHIGEAETCDSLSTTDTIEQFQDFSKRYKDGKIVTFHIGIPKGCENDLLKVLGDYGLRKPNVKYITF